MKFYFKIISKTFSLIELTLESITKAKMPLEKSDKCHTRQSASVAGTLRVRTCTLISVDFSLLKHLLRMTYLKCIFGILIYDFIIIAIVIIIAKVCTYVCTK